MIKDAALGKEIVTTAAATVVDKAVGIAGGGAFFRRSALERLSRDMRAAPFRPPSAPVSFQLAGAALRRANESAPDAVAATA